MVIDVTASQGAQFADRLSSARDDERLNLVESAHDVAAEIPEFPVASCITRGLALAR
jgi:hypothetical protein